MSNIPIGELDRETREQLNIELMPNIEQVSKRHIALGKVLLALKGLEEEEMFWVLQEAKSQFMQQGEAVSGEEGNGRGYIPPVPWILRVIAKHFGCSVVDLYGRSRKGTDALARQVAMYILRLETDMSLGKVGEVLCGKTPATCSYGFQKIAGMIEKSPELRRKIERIREEL